MARGCLLALAMYAAICVGYFFWLDTVFDRPGSYYGAAGLGLVVFLSIGALMNARTAWKDWSLASSARHAFPPRDGRLFAACGPIQPIGQPILAPFSGSPCCLCEYDLSTAEPSPDTNEKAGSDLAGFLLTPSEIQTSTGNVRLLGFPVLEEGQSYSLKSFTAARRARDFVSRTHFEDISGLRLLNAFAAIEDAWTDDDGSVEKNLQLKKVDPSSLFPDDLEAVWQEVFGNRPVDEPETGVGDDDLDEDEDEDDLDEDALDSADDSGEALPNVKLPTLKENRVAPGDQVCVIGRYDEVRRGILPVGSGMKAIRLIRGDIDTLERKARGTLWSHLLGGMFFLVMAHVATCFVMFMYLNSEPSIRKFSSEAFKAAEKGDVAKLQAMKQRGQLRIDTVDSDKRTLLMKTKDTATAKWLIDNGVPLNVVDKEGVSALKIAALNDRTEIVQLLIDAKANLNLRDASGETALSAADRHGHPGVAAMLRAAGSEDSVVTAKNGQPLPEDGGPQLRMISAYIQSLQDKNASWLFSLMTKPSNVEIDEEMWRNYQLSAPKTIDRFEGFANEDNATVVVHGKWGENDSPCKSTFQLRKIRGEWRIAGNVLEVN